MKKQPKAVYIIENGGYTELTYEEFCRREQICPLYADKLFLPLYGRLMEVSKEDYAEFYRAKRRQKYLDERSADNGDFSYDMLTTDEFSGEDILIAEQAGCMRHRSGKHYDGQAQESHPQADRLGTAPHLPPLLRRYFRHRPCRNLRRITTGNQQADRKNQSKAQKSFRKLKNLVVAPSTFRHGK